MDAELKTKIKTSIMEHLTLRGYPNITNDHIIQLLPELWTKLCNEKLMEEPLKTGFTYQQFCYIALQKKHQADTMEEVANFFRRR